MDAARKFESTALLAALLLAVLIAASCSQGQAATETLQSSPGISEGPAFPLDDPHYSRQVDTVETVDGLLSFSNSGAPGFTPHPTISTVAVLESSEAAPTAWAVYRFTLNSNPELLSIKINLHQGNLSSQYLVMLADFASGRWQYQGQHLGTDILLPADYSGFNLVSPGKYCYLALLVIDGKKINVAGIESETTGGGGGEYPIFDQYEDNDTLSTCTPIGPGSYIASTHDDPVVEMLEIGELKDRWDFYCIDLEAGEHFTATMKYEFVNHFDQPNGTFNDLDMLMYVPGVPDDRALDDFHEQWSSYRIYFTNMELVHFVVPATGTYKLGIRGQLIDQFTAPSNAEYVLQTFISPNTHTVSGYITQNDLEVDKKFLVVLTPGNFSGVTSLEAAPHGGYSISGVPDGTYTMEVHGSAGFSQHDYVYPNTKEVVVNGTNVNVSMSIDPFPG
jgi:hypothetical protein